MKPKQIVILSLAALLLGIMAASAQDHPWHFTCGDQSQVDILAAGLGNRSATASYPKILYIPNPAEVDSILIQVVAKVPPDVIPPDEIYIATPVEKIHLDTPAVITKGYGYHFETMLKPTNWIKIYVEGDTNPGYYAARAVVAYIFRKNPDGRFSSGKLVHQGLWWEAGDRPNTWSETWSIPAAAAPRDVDVTFVVTEKESSKRQAVLRLEAGSQSTAKTCDDPNFGDEVLVETLTLKGVPGDVTQIKATLTSPMDDGDSIYWSGLLVATSSCGGMDYGDAMEHGFPTLLSHNGARHLYQPGCFLGAKIDTEEDATPSEKADGDDNTGLDDEDGVEFKTRLTQGQAAQIEVAASTAGYLNAWFDWKGDGNWNDAADHTLIDVPLKAGVNSVPVAVPMTGLKELYSFCRFRFCTAPGLAVDGPAPDGEVEDYLVPVYTPVELSSFSAAMMDGAVVLQWETQSESDNLGFNVYRSTEEQGLFSQINTRMIPGAGSSASAHNYRYVDNTAAAGQVYYYQIVDIATNGTMQWHGPVMVEMVQPEASRLEQNSPNPFNAQTRIAYAVKQPGQVMLAIYNLQGQRVRTLVSNRLEAGSYSTIWDGRDDNGHDLPTGAYLYVLKMADSELSQRMTLIK
ncbi:MAG TPA: FlgD immunoglobulin-like domain containing protein [bacterium]|nr:FlgD immunoglobulin-like domain containing protein [bacterium]